MDVVVLTKSTMHGGFCVSGLDVDRRKWVRLVSDRNGASMMAFHLKYQNVRGSVEVLDVLRVETYGRVGVRNHTEDVQVKFTTLTKRGTVKFENLLRFYHPENHEYIFGNDSDSLTEQEMHSFGFGYSLVFVQVRNLTLSYRNGRGRASFEYGGKAYDGLRVTDPEYDGHNAFFTSIDIRNAYLVVSMPKEPFERNRRYYKFVAKIFPAI